MHLRPATTRDLHRLAEITVTSLRDDPTFAYMWRYEAEYPEDNYYFWELQLTQDIYNERYSFIVAATDEKDDFGKDVPLDLPIAYGIWERLGSDEHAKERRKRKITWHNMFDKFMAKATAWSVSKKYKRRDADFARLKAFEEAEAETRQRYFTSQHPELWYMQLLVTHRDFRRHGAGSAIVKWGAQQADVEGVWAGTESSPMGEPVYKSVGMYEVGRMVIQVEGDNARLDFPVMLRAPLKAGYSGSNKRRPFTP